MIRTIWFLASSRKDDDSQLVNLGNAAELSIGAKSVDGCS